MPIARALSLGLLIVAASAACARATPRYILYSHAKIVEEEGRNARDPVFGTYAYDAILDTLRTAGFVVLSEQRSRNAHSDSAAARLAAQVDSLLVAGVSPRAITVVGFSKGGWIAILASDRLRNPEVSFVFLGACGPWAFERPDLHVTGRLLSLYEQNDPLGVSCEPLFERRGPDSQARELALDLGLGHGTFFVPRASWLDPVIAWARGRDP